MTVEVTQPHRAMQRRTPRAVLLWAVTVGTAVALGLAAAPVAADSRVQQQDLFVDGGVSRPERDRTPVVTDAGGRIVWVAGLALGEEFRVTSHTNAVVVLRLRRF